MSEAPLPPFPDPPINVAISACLLGHEVRYDGTDRYSAVPHLTLDELYTFTGICPEVAIGLGVPREPIHLVADVNAPRAVGVRDPSRDVTERLTTYAKDIAKDICTGGAGNSGATGTLPSLTGVDGYVFMNGSPSCGIDGVKLQQRGSSPAAGRSPTDGADIRTEGSTRIAAGVFAHAITHARPTLPVEDSDRLSQPALLARFVIRTFVHAHWRRLVAARMSRTGLNAFHHTYGGLVSSRQRTAMNPRSASEAGIENTAQRYFVLLMRALAAGADASGLPRGHPLNGLVARITP